MARLFQHLYRGLVPPLVAPTKTKFSTSGSAASTTSGSSKNSSNNETTMTILKVVGGFLPGVYIGHVMTDQGLLEPPEDGVDEDGKDKDGKDKDKDEKKAGGKAEDAKGKAEEKGKDMLDSAKDK